MLWGFRGRFGIKGRSGSFWWGNTRTQVIDKAIHAWSWKPWKPFTSSDRIWKEHSSRRKESTLLELDETFAIRKTRGSLREELIKLSRDISQMVKIIAAFNLPARFCERLLRIVEKMSEGTQSLHHFLSTCRSDQVKAGTDTNWKSCHSVGQMNILLRQVSTSNGRRLQTSKEFCPTWVRL